MPDPYGPIYDGYNSWENDGDEINGPGANWPISPRLFDTFVALQPFILTEEMLAVFADCPDLVIRHQPDTYTVPAELEEMFIRRSA